MCTALGIEKPQLRSWIQVYLQRRSIQKPLQHAIFCLVCGPKTKKYLPFPWTTAPPDSRVCIGGARFCSRLNAAVHDTEKCFFSTQCGCQGAPSSPGASSRAPVFTWKHCGLQCSAPSSAPPGFEDSQNRAEIPGEALTTASQSHLLCCRCWRGFFHSNTSVSAQRGGCRLGYLGQLLPPEDQPCSPCFSGKHTGHSWQ